MNSNSKRKPRPNATSKPPRSKGLTERNVACDGVYSNARFMHAAASLVGCVVQLQVKNGDLYEGVFKTFSQQLDLVLEMAHRIDKKNTAVVSWVGPSLSGLLACLSAQDAVTEKLIFKLQDVVTLTAANVDLDYATRDSFTDAAISKFNGQIVERDLEPWEGPLSDNDGLAGLEGNEDTNGWDVDDMFRTNAEKYGVTSSYDSSLQGYTVQLEPKNTEEYKRQEARAMKIAQEIERSETHKTRVAVENGDEEERYSAVVRPPADSSGAKFIPPPRRRAPPGTKIIRNTPPPSTLHTPKPPHNAIVSPHVGSSPSAPFTHSHTKPLPSNPPISSPSPASTPTPTGTPKLSLSPHAVTTTAHQRPNSPRIAPSQLQANQEVSSDVKINGERCEKEEKNGVEMHGADSRDSLSLPISSGRESTPSPGAQIPASSKTNERKKEIDRKVVSQKGRDEAIAELKKFGSNFKLSDDNKENREPKEELQKSESAPQDSGINVKESDREDKENEGDKTKDKDVDKLASTVKKSTLNPNAKEFVLNPNAKAFTPRSPMSVTTPPGPTPVPPPRLQSPAVPVPQPQLLPGVAQPIFTNMGPQYVMTANPVSMPLTPPFAHAGAVAQGPRLRKVPMTMQPRHEMSPSIHVAAATGQPILAPAAIPTAPQLTVQYPPPQGVIPGHGHPQATMAYPQMYSFPPRMMTPQALGMVPTSHAGTYGESHIPTQVFSGGIFRISPEAYCPTSPHWAVSPHPGATAVAAAMPPTHHVPVSAVQTMVQQGTTGHHSNPSTPQSPAPLHAPSPVHQAPPGPHNPPAQTPPTGHPGPAHTPQPVVYHSQIGPQTPMQPGHHNHNPPISQASHVTHVTQTHPHPTTYPGTPQPVVLMPQQGVPNPHTHPASLSSSGPHALQGHPLHGHGPGSHAGTPTHVLSHPSMTLIPTSAPMVSAATPMGTTTFVPHPQAHLMGRNLGKGVNHVHTTTVQGYPHGQ